MKKKYFRKLALWMAVLMILLSVPTNAVAFPSTGATATEHMTATEGITETTLTDPDEEIVESFEWIIEDTASTETGLRSPSDSYSTTSTTSDSQFLTGTTIPEGVYALHSLANEGQWMSVSQDRYTSYAYMEQRAYEESPVSSFSRGSLFKISQGEDENTYIIRLMTNNKLGIGFSGSVVQAQGLSTFDEDVSGEDVFTITWSNGGYIIESVMDDLCIAAPSSTESFTQLVAQPASEAGDRAKWQLQPYTGVDRYGVTVVRGGGSLIAGRQITIRLDVGWSTVNDVTVTGLSLSSEYASIVTGTWNSTTSTLTLNLHDDGDFQIIAPFEDSEEDIVQNHGITYTVLLPFDEGVYYIENKSLELYVQIDNDTAPTYSANGAALELFAFDGGAYQRWTVEHIVDGYYKILSHCDKAASIDASYVNAERHIWQAFYLGDTYYNQQWKFTSTGRGTYVIRPRSGEAYSTDWCWAAQDDEDVDNGPNVEQKAYTSDSDYMDEWYLHNAIAPETFLLGIIDTDPAHEHVTALEDIRNDIIKLGYSGFTYVLTNSTTTANVQNNMANAKIFVSRSHGDFDAYGTCIYLNQTKTASLHSSDIYNFANDTPVIDLSDCDLMLFVACYTGKNEDNSLPHAAVAAGAKTAIGFKGAIGCANANSFTKSFFYYYNLGWSMTDSVNTAASKNGIPADSVQIVLNSEN